MNERRRMGGKLRARCEGQRAKSLEESAEARSRARRAEGEGLRGSTDAKNEEWKARNGEPRAKSMAQLIERENDIIFADKASNS